MKETNKVINQLAWDDDGITFVSKDVLRSIFLRHLQLTVEKVIPEEKPEGTHDAFEKYQRIGWNDCRRAMVQMLKEILA